MRNLIGPLLVVLLSFASTGATAAPDAMKCKAKFDPNKPDADPASPGWNVNCFSDEVFILDGSQVVTFEDIDPATSMPVTVNRSLVDCSPKPGVPGAKDSTNCFVGPSALQVNGAALTPAVERMLQLIRAKSGTVPQQDELVFFRGDFTPSNEQGPLFYRDINTISRAPINEVANIGKEVVSRDPGKPYVGFIDAGNTRMIYRDGFTRPGADKPDTDLFEPCGFAAEGFVPQSFMYPEPAVCPPGLFTFFDALSQATAQIYGPYLAADPAFKTECVALALSKNLDPADFEGTCKAAEQLASMPALKGGLKISHGSNGVVGSALDKIDALERSVWNGLLDVPGSLMGGNTFRPTGNGSYSVGMPPPFEGVSAPFEGKQRPRFHPMDLYVLGFMPWQEVPAVRTFIIGSGTVRTYVTEPAGLDSFLRGVGPGMGTRISGVSIRTENVFPDTTMGMPVPVVPRIRDFARIVEANGGERSPPFSSAPQYIRQLWVFITKPRAAMEATAADLNVGKPPEKIAEALQEQLHTQARHLAAIQKARRDFARYFYTMTSYRGRIYSTYEGDVDDNAYWEFGGARDDRRLFTGTGGLNMQMNGREPVPNSGGKMRTVLRLNTPGAAGKIMFTPQGGHTIRIDGDQTGPVPTNVFTIRLRVPHDPDAMNELRSDPRSGDGFFATVTLDGGPRPVTVRVPRDENAYIVPDGNFRNYSVLLNDIEEFRAGGRWTTFTLTPSNRLVNGMEIDYIRFSHETAAKDSEKACPGTGNRGADGWPDAEDNCPMVWNPSQDDGNGDGVGDACEDYDGDKIANACDNCPLLSNSSQRDRNKDNLGDACDPESTDGCFSDGTIAGHVHRPSAFGLLAVTALGAVMAWRRRRRR